MKAVGMTQRGVHDATGTHQPGYSGRAPSGNLRNFAAMSPQKFEQVYDAVMHERNDSQAASALEMVLNARHAARMNWGKPPEVPEDVWDTLLKLGGENV